MSYKKNISLLFVLFLFATAFFSRCAQPATPQGGPRDTLPPVLLGVNPQNFSTNFKSKEIAFTFNEYLQLKDVQKEILISPPMVPRPIFAARGKSIIIKFPPELKLDSNTTYKIDFGSAIRDNNEGNPAKRFEYVFSTGDHIDSLAMSGRLINALTGEGILNGFVLYFADEKMVHDSTKSDSTIFIGKKLSIARTDSTGNFLATYLKPISYRIYAIKDENGNQEYDMGNDLVGLSKNRFNPQTMKEFDVWVDPVKDHIEVSPQIKFDLFKEVRRFTQKLKEVTRPKEFQLQMVFASDSVRINAIEIDSVLSKNIVVENSMFNDSIRVWVKDLDDDAKFPDTLKGVVRYYTVDSMGMEKIDTTIFALGYFKKDESKTGAEKVADKLGDITNTVFLKFSNWIKRLFMGKKKKIALRDAAYRRYVADSLQRVSADSLSLVQRADSLAKADSLQQRIDAGLEIRRDSSKVFKPRFSVGGEMSPNNRYMISSDYPMERFDPSKIEVVRMSFKEKGEDDFNLEEVDMKEKKPTVRTVEKYVISRDSSDITNWFLDVRWMPLSEYHIKIDKDALMDITGAVNDSLSSVVKTFDPAKYAKVVIDLKLIDPTDRKSYIVSLLDSTNNVVETKKTKGEGKIVFDYVTPNKSYRLKFVDDRNGNGLQDIGSVLRDDEPERVEMYEVRKGVTLFPTKENWDVEFEIYPEKLFDVDAVIPERRKIEKK